MPCIVISLAAIYQMVATTWGGSILHLSKMRRKNNPLPKAQSTSRIASHTQEPGTTATAFYPNLSGRPSFSSPRLESSFRSSQPQMPYGISSGAYKRYQPAHSTATSGEALHLMWQQMEHQPTLSQHYDRRSTNAHLEKNPPCQTS